MKITKLIILTTLKCLVLHCGYMSWNSRWFLDTPHSSSFKAEHENFVTYTIIYIYIYIYINFIDRKQPAREFSSLIIINGFILSMIGFILLFWRLYSPGRCLHFFASLFYWLIICLNQISFFHLYSLLSFNKHLQSTSKRFF